MSGPVNSADSSTPLICLLLHENEPGRRSATFPLIRALLPQTRIFTWQRTAVDPALLELLQSDDYSPCLIFPSDRPETRSRAVPEIPVQGRRPLLVIPDGTWKEVRKIVRKSPYLDPLPVFSLTPQQTTRYRLRRNPDAAHICTSEVVAALMQPFDRLISQQLDDALEQFQIEYYRCRQSADQQSR